MKARPALLALFFAANVAGAAPVVVGDVDPRWRLELPEGWAPTAAMPEAGGGTVLASFSRADGRRLVVGRQRGNTDAAYDGNKTFFAGLEEGVKKATAGYRRLSARQRTLGKNRKVKIPVYDLWYRTEAGVRGSRFVIMKGYAVMATIDLPRVRRADAGARKVIESFEPAF